ncbi:hypothetical protein GCM10011586_28530 [Silvibacterium dinghuense]|nr:hypothetical protein GCM10011586_28530 [Silvibacterium dinghuense]
MTARAGDRDLESLAAQGIGHGDFVTGAIEDEMRGDAVAPGGFVIDMTHAAQVAFAFFADIAHKVDIAFRDEAGVFEGCRQSKQAGQTCSVVAGSRGFEPRTVEPGFDHRA